MPIYQPRTLRAVPWRLAAIIAALPALAFCAVTESPALDLTCTADASLSEATREQICAQAAERLASHPGKAQLHLSDHGEHGLTASLSLADGTAIERQLSVTDAPLSARMTAAFLDRLIAAALAP